MFKCPKIKRKTMIGCNMFHLLCKIINLLYYCWQHIKLCKREKKKNSFLFRIIFFIIYFCFFQCKKQNETVQLFGSSSAHSNNPAAIIHSLWESTVNISNKQRSKADFPRFLCEVFFALALILQYTVRNLGD